MRLSIALKNSFSGIRKSTSNTLCQKPTSSAPVIHHFKESFSALSVDFIRKVHAGDKELLPRKGTNDLKVPRYAEVSEPWGLNKILAEREDALPARQAAARNLKVFPRLPGGETS